MLGGLVRYLASANPENFQPMNANWGLVPAEGERGQKSEKRARMFRRGLAQFRQWLAGIEPRLMKDFSNAEIWVGSS
jgi:methylenetetrahydrofolate--tRNA-(uracil-5-)-methyltransferase